MATEERSGAGADALAEGVIIVLNEPQDVVNIATAVRAMMNMGLRRLRLVDPADYDARRIDGIAHGADVVIERTTFHDTLDEAIADVTHVVGTTARRRAMRHNWEHPRDAAPDLMRLARERAPVAVVFGREDRGLANEELDRCDRLLTVPTDSERASLNLAQAVLLICYELRLAGPGGDEPLPRPRRDAPPATNEQLERLFKQTHRTLQTIDFYRKKNPEAILRTVRAVYRRAEMDEREANLMRAIMIGARKYVERNGSEENAGS